MEKMLARFNKKRNENVDELNYRLDSVLKYVAIFDGDKINALSSCSN